MATSLGKNHEMSQILLPYNFRLCQGQIMQQKKIQENHKIPKQNPFFSSKIIKKSENFD